MKVIEDVILYYPINIILFVLLALCLFHKRVCPLHQFDKHNTFPMRGCMAVSIIFCHVAYMYENVVISPFKHFGAPIVCMFFFLSGYGLVKSYIQKGEKFMHGFAVRNALKLFIPLIIATALWCAISMVFFNYSCDRLFGGMLHGHTPLRYSWFMYVLVIFYGSFYIVFSLSKRIALNIILLLCITVSIYVAMRVAKWETHWFLSLFAFNCGTIIAFMELRFVIPLISHYRNIVVFIVALGLAFVLYFGIRNGSTVIQPIVIYLFIIICGTLSNRIMQFLSRYSFEIYLSHGICVPLFCSEFAIDAWWLGLLFSLVGSVALAVPLKYISNYVSKFLLRLCCGNQQDINVPPPSHILYSKVMQFQAITYIRFDNRISRLVVYFVYSIFIIMDLNFICFMV